MRPATLTSGGQRSPGTHGCHVRGGPGHCRRQLGHLLLPLLLQQHCRLWGHPGGTTGTPMGDESTHGGTHPHPPCLQNVPISMGAPHQFLHPLVCVHPWVFLSPSLSLSPYQCPHACPCTHRCPPPSSPASAVPAAPAPWPCLQMGAGPGEGMENQSTHECWDSTSTCFYMCSNSPAPTGAIHVQSTHLAPMGAPSIHSTPNTCKYPPHPQNPLSNFRCSPGLCDRPRQTHKCSPHPHHI